MYLFVYLLNAFGWIECEKMEIPCDNIFNRLGNFSRSFCYIYDLIGMFDNFWIRFFIEFQLISDVILLMLVNQLIGCMLMTHWQVTVEVCCAYKVIGTMQTWILISQQKIYSNDWIIMHLFGIYFAKPLKTNFLR